MYFCVFCHILAGRAVFDQTPSAYRIPIESIAKNLPSMAQMRTSMRSAAANSMLGGQLILRTLLRRANRLNWVIKDRYWLAVEQQSGETGDAIVVYIREK